MTDRLLPANLPSRTPFSANSMLPEPAAPLAFDVPRCRPPVAGAPRLTAACGELLREITVQDEYGDRKSVV